MPFSLDYFLLIRGIGYLGGSPVLVIRISNFFRKPNHNSEQELEKQQPALVFAMVSVSFRQYMYINKQT